MSDQPDLRRLTSAEALEGGRVATIIIRDGSQRNILIHEIAATSLAYQDYRAAIIGNDLIGEVTQYLGKYDPDADLKEYGAQAIMRIRDVGREVNIHFFEGILSDQNPAIARAMAMVEEKLRDVSSTKDLLDTSELSS